MDKQPKIFTVMAWTKKEDGTFRLSVHHVAGFDSKDAEERIKAQENDYLQGQLFIYTDRYIDYRGDKACAMYTTGHAREDAVSAEEYRKWVRRSLRDEEYDGDLFPAPFRRFHA